MEHLPLGVKDEEGCFVYQYVGGGSIGIRTCQSVDDKYFHQDQNMTISNGELVSIDLVSPSRSPGSTNGPFLRLSDREGWLFEKKYDKLMMKRIPVSSGLWCFFVDNCPVGMALRRHPIDRADMRVKTGTYQPMQKIYCDRKVQHPDTGVNFYRVQGTEGWVFDRRVTGDEGEHRHMLLAENMVSRGLFVYECIDKNGVCIRDKPDVGTDSRTDLSIKCGELVSVDAVRKSPFPYHNGPFLRLTDGSGWVFEKKKGQTMFKRLRLEQGSWSLKVLNSPTGIGLRRLPIDRQSLRTTTTLGPGTIVLCTRMVQSSSGVKFYQVQGSDDWVLDSRDGESLLAVVYRHDSEPSLNFSDSLNDHTKSWHPEFVRGVAASVDGVTEINFNETSRVLSFRTADGARVNVYFTTRTVGTALSHPVQGSTQLFRRNCTADELIKILENPRFHTGKGYKRRRDDPHEYPDSVSSSALDIIQTSHGRGILADEEDELRNAKLQIDKDLVSLQEKRQKLLTKIREADLERASEARSIAAKVQARTLERGARADEAARREQKERELKARTCEACSQVFINQHAKNQHYNAVHVFSCDYCGRDFNNRHSLNQHKNSTGHW